MALTLEDLRRSTPYLALTTPEAREELEAAFKEVARTDGRVDELTHEELDGWLIQQLGQSPRLKKDTVERLRAALVPPSAVGENQGGLVALSQVRFADLMAKAKVEEYLGREADDLSAAGRLAAGLGVREQAAVLDACLNALEKTRAKYARDIAPPGLELRFLHTATDAAAALGDRDSRALVMKAVQASAAFDLSRYGHSIGDSDFINPSDLACFDALLRDARSAGNDAVRMVLRAKAGALMLSSHEDMAAYRARVQEAEGIAKELGDAALEREIDHFKHGISGLYRTTRDGEYPRGHSLLLARDLGGSDDYGQLETMKREAIKRVSDYVTSLTREQRIALVAAWRAGGARDGQLSMSITLEDTDREDNHYIMQSGRAEAMEERLSKDGSFWGEHPVPVPSLSAAESGAELAAFLTRSVDSLFETFVAGVRKEEGNANFHRFEFDLYVPRILSRADGSSVVPRPQADKPARPLVAGRE